MIIEVSPLAQSSGGGGIAGVVYSMDAIPAEGATVAIPDSDALIVNLSLWPASDLNKVTIDLPPTKPGRRVFIYSDRRIAEVDVATQQSGVVVRNGVVALNQYDQTVFNTASLTIWARVVTS